MLRPTVGTWPIDSDTKASTALPWAVCVQPLARLSRKADEERPDIEAMPRCIGCRAYLSAPCVVIGGNCRCFLCGVHNDVDVVGDAGALFQSMSFEAAVRYGDDDSDGEGADGDDASGAGMKLQVAASVDAKRNTLLLRSGLTLPVYIVLVQASKDEAVLKTIEDALAAALCELVGSALVGVMTFSIGGAGFVDARGLACRRLRFDDAGAQPILANQWLATMRSAEICRAVARAACEICLEESLEGNLRANNAGYSFETLAIEQAVNIVSSSGASASRILVVCVDDAPAVESDSVILELGAPVVSNERDPDLAADKSYRLKSGDDGTSVELGRRAAEVGAVVDVIYVTKTLAGRSLSNALHVQEVSRSSGGKFLAPDSASDVLPTLVSRLKDSVGVHGLLRIRTTPEYAVRDVYGPTVHRDGSADGLFCLTAGRGESSTLMIDLGFSGIEGFAGASRRPGMQVAFQCVLIELGQPLCRIVRLESMQTGSSASTAAIRKTSDVAAITVVLLYKALDILECHGRAEARRILLTWHLRLVTAISSAGSSRGDIVETLVERSMNPVHPVDVLPTMVLGLLQSGLFPGETDLAFPSWKLPTLQAELESASPAFLVELLRMFADSSHPSCKRDNAYGVGPSGLRTRLFHFFKSAIAEDY
jgi:hypothetical protein